MEIIKSVSDNYDDITVDTIEITKVGDKEHSIVKYKKAEPEIRCEVDYNNNFTVDPTTPLTGRFSSKEPNESNGPKTNTEKIPCANHKCPNLVDPETAHDSVFCCIECWQAETKSCISCKYNEGDSDKCDKCDKCDDCSDCDGPDNWKPISCTTEPEKKEEKVTIPIDDKLPTCLHPDCDNEQATDSNYCEEHEPRPAPKKKRRRSVRMCKESGCIKPVSDNSVTWCDDHRPKRYRYRCRTCGAGYNKSSSKGYCSLKCKLKDEPVEEATLEIRCSMITCNQSAIPNSKYCEHHDKIMIHDDH